MCRLVPEVSDVELPTKGALPKRFKELGTRSGHHLRTIPGARGHLGTFRRSLEAPARVSHGAWGQCRDFRRLLGLLQCAAEATTAVWSLSRQQRGEDLRQSRGGEGEVTPVPKRQEGPPQESHDGDPKDGMDGVGEGTSGVAQGHARTGGSLGQRTLTRTWAHPCGAGGPCGQVQM